MSRAFAFAALIFATVVRADDGKLPPKSDEPILRLDADHPTADLRALAVSPDGKTLYAAGQDKVVRTWVLRDDEYVLQRNLIFRVPLGPGDAGVINALALSPDGKWLAVGGLGFRRGLPGQGKPGYVAERMGRVDDTMLRDEGMIYLFATHDPQQVRPLRAHVGAIAALTFVVDAEKPPILASLARETEDGKHVGRVRLWDVEGAEIKARKESATVTLTTSGWPRLAAWSDARSPGKLQVAIAQPGQPLRYWDGRDRAFEAIRDGDLCHGALTTFADPDKPGSYRLLAGVRVQNRGDFLVAWPVGNGKRPQGDEEQRSALKQSITATVVAGRLGGDEGDRAAVVQFDGKVYRLHLMDLAGQRFGRSVADFELWAGGRFPVLAAATRGDLLAVAGFPNQEVQLFRGKDAIDKTPMQKLQTAGKPRRFVAFVQKDKWIGRGKIKGLAVSGNGTLESEPKPGDRVRDLKPDDALFAFNINDLSSDQEGWTIDRPDPGDWRATHDLDEVKRVRFQVRRGDGEPKEIVLEKDEQLLQYALLPPTRQVDIPLLAVSFSVGGAYELHLFDGLTGARIRRFSGHVAPVRALAFSSDGRFLVSGGDDQSVFVWSLTNLDQHLGKHGTIRGLSLREEDGPRLQVASKPNRDKLSKANREALDRAGIERGDTVEGRWIDDKLQPQKLASEYYDALWLLAPDKKVTLVFKDKGKVELTLDQGMDDQQPLFALALVGSDKNQKWLGWAPQGEYDLGDPRLERFLGWHLNTGRAADPVEHQPVAVLRDKHFRSGLLAELIAAGTLKARVQAPVLQDPVIAVEIDGGEPHPAALKLRPDVVLVRGKIPRLRVQVRDFDAQKIGSVRFRFDNRDWKELPETNGTRLAALPEFPWTRDEHTIEVELRTRESPSRVFHARRELYYLPPPPTIELAEATKQLKGKTVRRDKLTFEALTHITAGQEVMVQLWDIKETNRKKLHEIQGTPKGKPLELRKELTLQEGLNVFLVTAHNRGATDQLKHLEEAEAVPYSIYYSPVPLPDIYVTVKTASDKRLPAAENVPLLVVEQEIRIETEVKSEVELEHVKIDGNVVEAKGTPPRFTLAYRTKSTDQTEFLDIEAKPKDGKARTFRLALRYEPPLPEITIQDADRLDRLAAGTTSVKLLGTLDPPLKQGQEVTFQPMADQAGKEIKPRVYADGAEFEVTIPVKPGLNPILAVTKQGKRKNELDFKAYVLRPPTILDFDYPRMSKESTIPLEIKVRSPKDLTPQLYLTNRQRLNAPSILARSAPANNGEPWIFKGTDVILAESKNDFDLRVENADGKVSRSFSLEGPPIPKPTVVLTDPGRDFETTRGTIKISYEIQSKKAVKHVHLIHNGTRKVLDVKALTADVDLYSGGNDLEVEVEDENGQKAISERRTLQVVPAYVRVRFTEIHTRSVPKVVEKPDAMGNFPKVDTGIVTLHGRLEWPEDDATPRQPVLARARVNQSQQLPVEVGERDGAVRKFEVELHLTSKDKNVVTVEFDGIAVDPKTPPRFEIAGCAKPIEARRLHLLVLGVDEKDQKKMGGKVLAPFEGRQPRAVADPPSDWQRVPGSKAIYKEFPTQGVFTNAYCYVLSNKPELPGIRGLISHLRGTLEQQYQEVVIVYYQGEATLLTGGHMALHLHLSKNFNDREQALSLKMIQDALSAAPAAQLLMLDLDQIGKDTAIQKASYQNEKLGLGIFHYAWITEPKQGPKTSLTDNLQKVFGRRPVTLQQMATELEKARVAAKLQDSLWYYPLLPDDLKPLLIR